MMAAKKEKNKDIPDIINEEPKNTLEDIEVRIRAIKKEREEEYYRQYGRDTREKYTGEEVGHAFLREFIMVYKGSVGNFIPDEVRAKMVNSLDNYKDMAIYQKYRDIYWHFLVKTNERETYCADARYWYLKLKLAIADGEQIKNDETDYEFLSLYSPPLEPIKNNFEKIQGILEMYISILYSCRCIEIGIEIIANALGIDDSPFKGRELFNTYFNEANALIKANKELKLKPIRKKDIEPNKSLIKNAKYAASFVENEPDRVHEVFGEFEI